MKANRGAAGVDHVSVERYASDLDANLERPSESLRMGTCHPQAIRRHFIPKPGSQEKRPLGIPTIQDRVVRTALRMVLEPIYERDFTAQSYGFRPGMGCKDALRRVDERLKAGYVHIVDADLKSYFDTIPKDRLLARVAGKVADGRILKLVESFLGQSVLEDTQEWVPEQGTPQGTPQGTVISPLLSNIYLDPLDHLMAGRGFEMVRYADDFGVLCPPPSQGQAPPTRSRRGSGRGAGLDGESRSDIASGEDPAGGRQERRVRLPWVPFRAWPPLAAQEEPGQTQGQHPGEDRADGGKGTSHGDRGHQPDPERLVRILPAELPADVSHC